MNKILLAVDDSVAGDKAVHHVAGMIHSQKELAVHIFHAIGPVPPALRESRGAEDPREEKVIEQELRQKQDSWREKAKTAAEPAVKKVRLALEGAGAKPEHISCSIPLLIHGEDLPNEMVKAARETGSDRIVLGRNCFPWIKEIFADHLDEEIEKSANGISVSVID